MIRIMPEGTNISRVEITMHLPHDSIFEFLQKKGYEVKKWLWKFEDESFPAGISYHESWTFTATKPGETQSENTLFLKVFEMEFKQLLNEL